MARTDIARLLTGMPSNRPDPMAMGGNAAQQRLAFGAERAQGMQRGVRGLMGQDPRTTSEKLQMAMAQLDPSKASDLRKIAQLQQATGDFAGAAKTAAAAQQASQEKDTRDSLIRIARAQGNDEMVDFLLSGGPLATAGSVLLGRQPVAKSSTVTKQDREDYDLYWKGFSEEEQVTSGGRIVKPWWKGGDDIDQDVKDKLYIVAERIYDNNPAVGREASLRQAMGLTPVGGTPQAQEIPDVPQGDSFSYMKDKKD